MLCAVFCSQIFRLVVFSMHPKEEFTFPFSLHYQKKKNYQVNFHQQQIRKEDEWRWVSYISFTGFCKRYLFRDRRPFLCFKNGLILNSIPPLKIYLHKMQLIFIKLLSFFEQNAFILKDRSSVVQKKKKSFHCLLFTRQINHFLPLINVI